MDRAIMEPIITYIEDHLSEELDNRLLASVSGYSESHFIRLFRQTTGLSPTDYVRKRRITEIVRTVGHENRPLSDVAFFYGFNSKENFTRAFKSEHGILPTEWKHADCSLRLFEPHCFHTTAPVPQIALCHLSPFTLRAYDFADTYPPSCWNRYNAEGRSSLLSGGRVVTDYGVMTRGSDGKRSSYAIGIRSEHAQGDKQGTISVAIDGGLYAAFETQAADPISFVATIHHTWDWIFESWLPDNGYVRREGFEFESYVESSRLYSERIYIPIRKE
ncbi:MAG: helix-turn-helix domain-containing protein [Ruminococcaceae bacterium]|nr:helix-turn-helix domain-containing protein [Oscillospiraceae bacterium]